MYADDDSCGKTLLARAAGPYCRSAGGAGEDGGHSRKAADRSKGTVDTITVMVVSFFFGASYGRNKDQETINNLSKESEK